MRQQATELNNFNANEQTYRYVFIDFCKYYRPLWILNILQFGFEYIGYGLIRFSSFKSCLFQKLWHHFSFVTTFRPKDPSVTIESPVKHSASMSSYSGFVSFMLFLREEWGGESPSILTGENGCSCLGFRCSSLPYGAGLLELPQRPWVS